MKYLHLGAAATTLGIYNLKSFHMSSIASLYIQEYEIRFKDV